MIEQEYREFPSYNGLDRMPMFMGIPLIPAVMLLMSGVMIFIIGGNLFGMTGFLFGFIVFPIFLLLREISKTDDKALNILYIEMVYQSKRRAFKEFGNTLTFLPEKYFNDYENLEHNFTKGRAHKS